MKLTYLNRNCFDQKVKQLIATLLPILVSLNLYARNEFVVIDLPVFMQQEIRKVQNFVSSTIPGNVKFNLYPGNRLHITLKTISDLDKNELNNVKKILRKIASKYRLFNLQASFKNSRIRFTKGGILLMLDENKQLSRLANEIYKELKNAKKKKLIRNLDPHFDFPNRAHITIGTFDNAEQTINKYKKLLNNLAKNYKSPIDKSFIVKRFILLSSNAPLKPRTYTKKDTFNLK